MGCPCKTVTEECRGLHAQCNACRRLCTRAASQNLMRRCGVLPCATDATYGRKEGSRGVRWHASSPQLISPLAPLGQQLLSSPPLTTSRIWPVGWWGGMSATVQQWCSRAGALLRSAPQGRCFAKPAAPGCLLARPCLCNSIACQQCSRNVATDAIWTSFFVRAPSCDARHAACTVPSHAASASRPRPSCWHAPSCHAFARAFGAPWLHGSCCC